MAIVNPTRVRNFARSTGQLAKTDKLDARIIAHFAQAVRPQVRPLRTPEEDHLNALVTRRRQVVTMLTSEKNRKATTHHTLQDRVLVHIAWLEAELKELGDRNRTIHPAKCGMEREGSSSPKCSRHWASYSLHFAG